MILFLTYSFIYTIIALSFSDLCSIHKEGHMKYFKMFFMTAFVLAVIGVLVMLFVPVYKEYGYKAIFCLLATSPVWVFAGFCWCDHLSLREGWHQLWDGFHRPQKGKGCLNKEVIK